MNTISRHWNKKNPYFQCIYSKLLLPRAFSYLFAFIHFCFHCRVFMLFWHHYLLTFYYLNSGKKNALDVGNLCSVLCVCVCVGMQARYRKEQTLPKTVPWIPPVDNLLKDSTDGCALAALLHFYCPDLVNLEGRHPCQLCLVCVCV